LNRGVKMSTLKFEKFKIKGATLGDASCLPDIKNDDYIRAALTILPEVTEKEKTYIGKGMIPTLLPHQVQNQYDRAREELEFDGAVLENEYLKATFVTSLGGRLWSLYDKKEEKELLYANDVFQPGNLALRNAWFSGGVEWNIGIKGHNMWTCSPLFAEELKDTDGTPMLRMYEFERIRGVAYSITAKLEKIGVNVEEFDDSIRISVDGPLVKTSVKRAPAVCRRSPSLLSICADFYELTFQQMIDK